MNDINEIKLSIIIPCYNYGHLIEKAIASAATEHPSVEVIVINDGSTDNSLEVLRELLARYSFTLIDQDNVGLSGTRNNGIESSNGEFLLFLDADDYLVENAVERCLDAITNNDDQFIIAQHYSLSGKKKTLSKPVPVSSSNRDNVLHYISKKLSIVNGGCLMHRDIFAQKRYNTALKNSEDIPVFIYALANFKSSVLQQPIVNIVKHTDSMRHDIAAILETGTRTVEESFKPGELPTDIISLKKLALAQRYSSIGRACFKAGRKKEARYYYKKSLAFALIFGLKRGTIKSLLKTYF
ncbi:hypothetical protein EDC56_3051 [Sinobacterium caligoides]|uniref:Glycosyltransferase 2-like domain-containing protein n=1 Tax=Sinobacterium caligoides TaxID=933926 RepID=A0A3N2DG92_9GAMM|nr:glycosyltransferase family 2 protein [Sinobacterium caligoides]ROR98816.1 hypothetical protein EDC56_3051 [Sinobacterium caligoides]